MMSAPRLLVIGANGFVGAHVMRTAADRFECISAGRGACDLRIDIEDAAGVAQAFQEARPQVVALLAAMADIDRCQQDPAKAHSTNALGAANVARECARSGARLLFASSGAVFDGTCQEYREDSQPSPVNVYGESKVQAEALVRGLLPEAVIVRLSLVLGFPLRAGTNALLEKLRARFQSGTPVRTPTGEYRNAIDVDSVALWMLDLAAAPHARGVFHLGSSDALSRYEIVRELARTMGFRPELVVAGDEPRPDRAPRGRHELLLPTRIREFSDHPVPTCRQAIERCTHVSV
jgi:dTDP-4-dehydrorhamnose reductase